MLTDAQLEKMRVGREKSKKVSLSQKYQEVMGVKRKFDSMPASYRRLYLKAMGGKSMAAAVKSFCIECVGYDRSEVTRCTAEGCPLFPYRPYAKKEKEGVE